MSDPRMMGGPPPGGAPGGQDPVANMEQNRSLLNPADATMAMQEGKIDPNMSVRDFLQQNMGVDVDGPVTQLIEASKKQLQNRTAIGKAANMGKPGQMPQGRPAMVQPGQGGPPPGLDSLMGQMRG
ncbi:MAG: hypothetical protein WC450_12425 [Candidatus Omnitrophota bacterium]